MSLTWNRKLAPLVPHLEAVCSQPARATPFDMQARFLTLSLKKKPQTFSIGIGATLVQTQPLRAPYLYLIDFFFPVGETHAKRSWFGDPVFMLCVFLGSWEACAKCFWVPFFFSDGLVWTLDSYETKTPLHWLQYLTGIRVYTSLPCQVHVQGAVRVGPTVGLISPRGTSVCGGRWLSEPRLTLNRFNPGMAGRCQNFFFFSFQKWINTWRTMHTAGLGSELRKWCLFR